MSDQSEEYRGKHVLVRFEGKKCVHSRNCVLGRPDVFIPNAKGPWIQPDQASAEAVAALAAACPSGAITYERLDGGENEAPPAVNVVRVRENGPLAVVADMTIEGHGKAFRATLCRCGASKNKPFCDSSHVAAGFRATGEPDTQESPALDVRDGPLTVSPRKDGPLKLDGNLEICAGTGRTVKRVTRAMLCRCGGSASKPFCDGTHNRNGFTSD